MARHRHSQIRAEQDAYGQIYQALVDGRDAREIMERDDGLIYGGDPADYFAPAELAQLVVCTGWRVRRFIDDGTPRFAVVLEKERGSARQQEHEDD